MILKKEKEKNNIKQRPTLTSHDKGGGVVHGSLNLLP